MAWSTSLLRQAMTMVGRLLQQSADKRPADPLAPLETMAIFPAKRDTGARLSGKRGVTCCGRLSIVTADGTGGPVRGNPSMLIAICIRR